jgi:TonB-dependent siderophore receptor
MLFINTPIAPRPLLVLTVLLVALMVGGQAARGEEKDKEDLPTYTLEEMVVEESKLVIPTTSTTATKMVVPLRLTPASVGVVSHDLVESQAGTILGDALKNVSGVNVQTGFGIHDFFVIRGFDSLSNGLVLTDGAAEPEVSFYNLYNIERVEVLKGPGAFLYGGNPLSGTVNLVRKRPLWRNFADITGSYSRFQTYRGTVDMGLANRDAGLAFRLNALQQRSDNYRDDKDNSGFSVNPALEWRPSSDTALQFNFEYASSDYKADSGLPVLGSQLADVPRRRSYQSPFDFSDQVTYRVRIDFSTRMGKTLQVRHKFYYTDFDWASRGTLLTGPPRDLSGVVQPDQVSRILTLLDDRQKLVGNQLEAVLDFHTGAVEHTLLAGFELSRLGDEYKLDVAPLPNMDVLDPVETATEPLFIIPQQAGDARSLTLAPYLVERLSLSEQYQVFLGGRFDAIDYEDAPNNVDQSFNKFSPMFGLVYTPVPELSFYGNAGRAFAPPSSLGRGARQAEESTQFEVGVRKPFFDDRVQTTLALYRLSKDVASDDGVTRLTGKQRSRGLEVELAAVPAPGWQAFAAYAFSSAELEDFEELLRIPTPDGGLFEFSSDRSGQKPAFAPEHLLNLWTAREFGRGVGVGAGARYLSRQFIAADNAFEIDGVLTLNASIYFEHGPRRLRINVANLTNRDYETRGFGSTSVIPAAPFSLHGTVGWAF